MTFWIRAYVSDIDLLKLAKQGLLGNGTKFKVLKIDNDLKFVSKQLMSFARNNVLTE